MPTYSHPISILWGIGPAPTTVKVIDASGAAQNPTITTAISETPSGSTYFTAVATYDTAWGVCKDLWSNGDGLYYPGDGPPVGATGSVTQNVLRQLVTDDTGLGNDQLTGGSAMFITALGVWNSITPESLTETGTLGTSVAALPTAAEIATQVGETVNTGGTGSGDTAIDHDGADGVTVDGEPSETDVMRFTLPGGGGADDVEVVAYLKADYDAGLRGSANRQGTTSTGSDGRWVAPLMLDAGTYTILGNRGGYVVAAVTVVVP